jgi:hypothetical protein
MRDYRITWYRGHKFTTWAELRRLWSRDYVHYVQIDHPDGTRTFPDMTGAHIQRIARDIADSVIDDARNSGPDPIAWVTGNSMMPPLRSFDGAEDVWQHPANEDGEAFTYLAETLESMLADADVALECPEYDNALYAVDLARFEYSEDEAGETLQDDWRAIVPAQASAAETPGTIASAQAFGWGS